MAQAPRAAADRSLVGVGTSAARRVRLRVLAPAAQHALLFAVTVMFMFPFYWMIVSSLKTTPEIFARPLVWWPHVVRWARKANNPSESGYWFGSDR